MSWAHSQVISAFGEIVTDRIGGAKDVTFRIPVGIVPADHLRQIALSFVADELPVGTPQGRFSLSFEFGTDASNPRVQDKHGFEPLAQTLRGGGRLQITDFQQILTNSTYEFDVLAPALPSLVPVFLRVDASSDPASLDPAAWAAVTAIMVVLVLGEETLQPMNQGDEMIPSGQR